MHISNLDCFLQSYRPQTILSWNSSYVRWSTNNNPVEVHAMVFYCVLDYFCSIFFRSKWFKKIWTTCWCTLNVVYTNNVQMCLIIHLRKMRKNHWIFLRQRKRCVNFGSKNRSFSFTPRNPTLIEWLSDRWWVVDTFSVTGSWS